MDFILLNCIVAVGCWLGYCFALTRFTAWPVEYTPLFSSALIITILYAFAYLGYLPLGVYCILIFGGALFLLSPIYIRNDSKTFFEKYLTPGFSIWVAISLLLAIYAANTWLRNWDDFGEWAPHVKSMYFNMGFVRASDYGINLDFPPGPGLFYFPFFFLSHFSDSALKFAQNLLCMTPLTLLFSRGSWRQWKLIISFAIAVLLLLILVYSWHVGFNIYLAIDSTIGVFFGGMLFLYYGEKNYSSALILLTPIIFAFNLLKPKLYIFALLLSGLIFLDRQFQSTSKKGAYKAFWLLVPTLVAVVSWHHYLVSMNIVATLQIHATPTKIMSLLGGELTPFQHQVLLALAHYPQKIALSLMPILLLAGIYYFSAPLSQRRRFMFWQIFMSIGFLLYLSGILMICLFTFDQAIEVTWGVTRFYTIYLMGWAIFILGNLYQVVYARFESHVPGVPNYLVYCSGAALLGLCAMWAVNIHHQASKQVDFARIALMARKINHTTPPNAKITILQNKLTPSELNQLNYLILPRKVVILNEATPQQGAP